MKTLKSAPLVAEDKAAASLTLTLTIFDLLMARGLCNDRESRDFFLDRLGLNADRAGISVVGKMWLVERISD